MLVLCPCSKKINVCLHSFAFFYPALLYAVLLLHVTFPFRKEVICHPHVCDTGKNSQSTCPHTYVNVHVCSAPDWRGRMPSSQREEDPCSCHLPWTSFLSWEERAGWRRRSRPAVSPLSSREEAAERARVWFQRWVGARNPILCLTGERPAGTGIPSLLLQMGTWDVSKSCVIVGGKKPCPYAVALPYPCPSRKIDAAFCSEKLCRPRWPSLRSGTGHGRRGGR